MIENKHPNLKMLLVVFLAVFLILTGLAGLKMYRDTADTSPEIVGSREKTDQSGNLTEEMLRKQLADMDKSDDTSKLLSTEDAQKQLDIFDKADDTSKRMTTEELKKQVASFDTK